MTNVEKAPLCKCGCGRPVQGKYDRTRKSRGVMKGDWHDFIKGHHAGYMTRVTERGEAPLCACGCGQQIEDTHKVGNRRDGIRAGEWKRYIHGHNKGRKGTGIREILDAEKLHELHWEDHLNCDGVAKHLGISEDYVKDLFKEYDVQRWDKNLYPREWFALPYEQLHDAMRLLVGEYYKIPFSMWALHEAMKHLCNKSVCECKQCGKAWLQNLGVGHESNEKHGVNPGRFCSHSCRSKYYRDAGVFQHRRPTSIEAMMAGYLHATDPEGDWIFDRKLEGYGNPDFHSFKRRVIVEANGLHYHERTADGEEASEKDRRRGVHAALMGWERIVYWEDEIREQFGEYKMSGYQILDQAKFEEERAKEQAKADKESQLYVNRIIRLEQYYILREWGLPWPQVEFVFEEGNNVSAQHWFRNRYLLGEDRVQAIHGKRSVYNLGANVIHVDTFDKVGAIGEYSELYYD